MAAQLAGAVRYQLFFCFTLLLWFVGVRSQDGPGPMVDTSSGRVVGLYTDKAKVFRSIPYARPPVGDLRWQDPKRVFPVPGILQATEDPPGCPQILPCERSIPHFCPPKASEDCLFLNIFTPINATQSSKLSVMVYIHGGTFVSGYSGGYIYDGQYIANKTGVIVVTINYRVGVMGFLVFGDGEEGDDPVNGNFGIRDQRMALEWMRENIANFGGNPNDVTLWGQSAGAMSVAIHAVSVKSAGLFNKVILESVPFDLVKKSVAAGAVLGREFARKVGCKSIQCLREKNISELIAASDLSWAPVVDNIDFSDLPISLWARGQLAPVPMILGTNSEESVEWIYQSFPSPVSVSPISLHSILFPPSLQPLEAKEVVRAKFPLHAEALIKFYLSSAQGDCRPIMAALASDNTFNCNMRHAVWGVFNSTLQQASSSPIFLYIFNHSLSFDFWGDGLKQCDDHSCHSAELTFTFHSLTAANFTPTAQELDLAANMTRYLTNFAKTGNPNDFFAGNPNDSFTSTQSRQTLYKTGVQRLPDWDPFYATADSGTKNAGWMKFNSQQSEMIHDYDSAACALWDSFGYS